MSGSKTSTVRLNGVEYGRDLILTDGRRVVAATLVEQSRMKVSEALRYFRDEGFQSQEEFLRYLKRIYRDVGLQDQVTIVRFSLTR